MSRADHFKEFICDIGGNGKKLTNLIPIKVCVCGGGVQVSDFQRMLILNPPFPPPMDVFDTVPNFILS